MLKFIDRQIRRSFSDAAVHYDVLSSLHKEIGRELFAQIREKENVEAILDVGMGTGWLTNKISFYFPESRLIGIDLADGMARHAKARYEDLHIIQANAKHLPFARDTFSIIISNLAYQWVDDLATAFAEAHRVLKPGGEIYISLFGFQTFRELFDAFAYTADAGCNGRLQFQRLPSVKTTEKILKVNGFHDLNVNDERIKVRFADMMGLVKWIKDIGANRISKNAYIGKDLLLKASEHYNNTYVDRLGVFATFEVLWVYARK